MINFNSGGKSKDEIRPNLILQQSAAYFGLIEPSGQIFDDKYGGTEEAKKAVINVQSKECRKWQYDIAKRNLVFYVGPEGKLS